MDNLEVRFVLPEGASFAKSLPSGPFGSEVSDTSKIDYFDLQGRPVRVFT